MSFSPYLKLDLLSYTEIHADMRLVRKHTQDPIPQEETDTTAWPLGPNVRFQNKEFAFNLFPQIWTLEARLWTDLKTRGSPR